MGQHTNIFQQDSKGHGGMMMMMMQIAVVIREKHDVSNFGALSNFHLIDILLHQPFCGTDARRALRKAAFSWYGA